MLSVSDSRVRDISNSPAYTFLDELLKQGKLSASEVELFKQKYQKLHEIVIQTYSNEKLLLDKAKELKGLLQAEQLKLEQRTILARDTESDLDSLSREEREWAAKVHEVTDERALVGYELEELQNIKKEQQAQLEEKYKKSLSALDPVVSKLNAKIEELKEEIEKQQEIYNKENSSVQDYLDKIDVATKAITALEKEKLKKRAIYQQATGEPERLKTNISMIEAVAKDLEDEAAKLLEEIKVKENELNSLQDERRVANQGIEELGVKLENFRLAIAKRRTNLDDIRRAREIEEQKRDSALEKHRSVEAAKADQQEALRRHMASQNEYHKLYEHQKKMYEKLRRKRETVTSIQKPLKEQAEVAARQLEEMEYQYSQQKQMLHEIKQDEELFISQYLSQEKLEEDTADLLFGVNNDRKEYEEKIKVLDKEERQLQHQISQLSAQRELMAREASRATAMYRETKEDLKVKNLILMDLDKQTIETFARLKSCSTKYERMKNQRNKLANLTQSSSQALAEMKEKIKILQNEVEILRNESLSKDKALGEEVRIHQNEQNSRDAMRVEQNKLLNALRIKQAEESQQMNEMIKLNAIVNNAELQMMSLRKDYAHAVDNRNLTGIQLIDRNDELCILYEKKNIQANILKQGDDELRTREEDIRLVERDIAEISRRIEVGRRNIPSISVYASTTRTLQQLEQQLADEKKLTVTLCEQLETPNPESTSNTTTSTQPQRCRHLKGMDPEPEQLAAKIEVLEERLNDKKEQLLEKELVLDEVTSLSDKLRMQAAESRGTTLEIAKKVNEYQSQIRGTTRKMMATVSELSMYQATAMKLELEKSQRLAEYQEAQQRVAAGQAPNEEAEAEWMRMERDRQTRHEQFLHTAALRRADEADGGLNSSLIRTTAEPRPNAYIPEELGIPRPYGQLAPFKPTIAGSSMRHIRKPEIKEIQI